MTADARRFVPRGTAATTAATTATTGRRPVDLGDWIEKHDAAALLECHPRQLERWREEGEQLETMRYAPNGRGQKKLFYLKADVDRLAHTRAAPPFPVAELPPRREETTALALPAPEPLPELLALVLAAVAQAATTATTRDPYLSIEEAAAEYPSLSVGRLRRLLAAGTLTPIPGGRPIRLRRRELENL